jgi:hypothetical protein
LLIELDEDRAEDPGRVGAKAAWLARGRRVGLPILPGVVVDATVSSAVMALGAKTLEERGSGGARLVVMRHPLPPGLEAAIVEAASRLADTVVVRSSSMLEAGAEWSGAFTSYLDIRPEEAPAAVRGCWASAFGVHTLERFAAADVDVGSTSMAVLIQPALSPGFGGTARVEADGSVTVIGIAGSPALLVGGWERGSMARVDAAGLVDGDGGIDPVLVAEVAAVMREAAAATGANACEWASVGGDVTLLQLGAGRRPRIEPVEVDPDFGSSEVARLARLVRRFPGPLGETHVLPWAVASPMSFLDPVPPVDVPPLAALDQAESLAAEMVAAAWGSGSHDGAERASQALRRLRGGDPAGAAELFARLLAPDARQAKWVLGLLAAVRHGLAERGSVSRPELGWHVTAERARSILVGAEPADLQVRFGFDRWEPFDAAVVIARGASIHGVPAAPGVAVGRMCFVADAEGAGRFRPRDVVVGTHALPNLAPLLWDASAVVTLSGGPGAHLFESARALGIPAVCGVRLEDIIGGGVVDASERISLAVDGAAGRVWADTW